MRGLGRILLTDHLEVKEGFRPTELRGVRILETQAAHRGSGCTWVQVSRQRDLQRFSTLAKGIPAKFILPQGQIRAPLHLFAGSKTGAAMLLGSERASTVLPTWENQLNCYMESHGERGARNRLLQLAGTSKSSNPAVIAADTLERVYSVFLPELVTVATRMAHFYHSRARQTHTDDDNLLAGKAEETRDFLRCRPAIQVIHWFRPLHFARSKEVYLR